MRHGSASRAQHQLFTTSGLTVLHACSIHVASVVQITHMLLTRGGVMKSNAMTQLQQLATYISAVVHDFQHGGVNNDFLVKTFHPLAMTYNDISPLENHHLASALVLLHQPQHLFLSVSYPPHTCMLPCLPCSCVSCFLICISQGRTAHVPACELATYTYVILSIIPLLMCISQSCTA